MVHRPSLPSLFLYSLVYLRQVRAAHSLLSIIHSMKLMLLLSDEVQIAHRRDAELKEVHQEKEEIKRKAIIALIDTCEARTGWPMVSPQACDSFSLPYSLGFFPHGGFRPCLPETLRR